MGDPNVSMLMKDVLNIYLYNKCRIKKNMFSVGWVITSMYLMDWLWSAHYPKESSCVFDMSLLEKYLCLKCLLKGLNLRTIERIACVVQNYINQVLLWKYLGA